MNDFDFLKYFDLAKDLQDSEDEASLRSSISRAYYSVFHEAKTKIEQVNPYVNIKKGVEAHGEVKNYFSRIKPELSDKLEKLRQARNQADYDSLPHISKREASSAIIETEKILKLLKSVK